MKQKRSIGELVRRYVVFLISLFFIAFGTSLAIRANLGSSPISCPPYIWSLIPGSPLTMGEYIICIQVLLILTQIILLKKNYQPLQLLQLVVSLFFGFYTDLTMWMTIPMQFDSTVLGYCIRFVELCLGGAIMAFGIALEVHCDVLLLAYEGFFLAVSKTFNIEFGKVKIASDTSMVVIVIICCFIFFGRWNWELIGVGTLFSMFYVGFMVRLFNPHFNWIERFFRREVETAAVSEPEHLPLVITISREYGSGGHVIGEKLAEKLGVKLYDKYLIDEAAEELGYSREFVKENEQNIPTGKLWELIFTDDSIPISMNPSKDDAIFVSQSRAIKRIALNESCVIIGRCANWILRHDENSFHVFVCSDIDFAVRRVSHYLNVDAETAKEQILQTNKARANHYWKYTGGNWADARGYDLVVNTSKISIDTIVEMICEIVKKVVVK